MEDYKFKDLTRRIIGCAMEVHKQIGPGFPEGIYQRCLAIEMRREGLNFESEVHLPLYYREEPVGSRRVDFLVEEAILLELKATADLTPVHHAQIINYLNAYRLEVGLLLNFGQESLIYKRFVKTQKNSPLQKRSGLQESAKSLLKSAKSAILVGVQD
ncbi:GxxExxY protein [Hymenobacter coccineus]|uniref:GxxExxY protein n=1 Tax=Hymenobacter coccineus TaxID=1908235 RepID=A0A1G1THA0_9BACT|nr:GxxExxY protein [Hymenobacter coccineus]OGX90258.1 GxxExxY protein [Hymenobacter coccineus]